MNYIKKSCLFCKEKERVQKLYPRTVSERDFTPEVFSARRSADNLHYEIVRCQNCGLVYSREILPQEITEKLYSQSGVTYGKYAGIISQDYWRPLKPFMGSIGREAALEIGCGSGFFLEKLADESFRNVFGCEPSIEARQKSVPAIRPNIHTGVFKKGVYPARSFDLICSFQTLDHLSDPLETVKICFDLLKSAGLAYFITHDVDSLQARILREKSPIIDVEHVYLFNKNTLRRIFEEAGFEVLKVSNLKNSYPMRYWLKMLPPGKFSDVLRGAVEWLGLGSLSLPIAAGNIYIVAKCKKS